MRARLCEWLAHLSMLYALPAFIATGYDDVDFIASAGLTEADVDALGVVAPGHRRKLLCLYAISSFVTPAAGALVPALPAAQRRRRSRPALLPPARGRISPLSSPGAGGGGGSGVGCGDDAIEEDGAAGEEDESGDADGEASSACDSDDAAEDGGGGDGEDDDTSAGGA